MSLNKKLLFYIAFALIGLGILAQSLLKNPDDQFWNIIGVVFFLTSLINIYRIFKYKTNEEYAQKITIQNNDERNKFLADKAKSAAFYIYIEISGIGVLIFRMFGYYEISQMFAYSICILVFLYWLSYSIIKRIY